MDDHRLADPWPGGGAPFPVRDLGAGAFGEARSFDVSARSEVRAAVTVRAAQGPQDIWARVPGRTLAVTQLTPGPCRGQLLRAELGDLGLDAGGFDGDLRMRGAMAQDSFSLVCVLEQDGVANQWGHAVEAGDILVVPPGGELDGRFQGRTAYAAVTAPWALILRRAAMAQRLIDPRLWAEAGVHSPPPAARAACREALRRCSEMSRSLDARAPDGLVGLLRQALLDAVLTALAQAADCGPPRQGFLNAARIVRLSEDYLDGGAGPGVQIDELCRALGISRRTLYRAFQDLLDVSPKAYLRLKNLSAARGRLLEAADRPATVTQVALDHGFWELGRFSGAYRTMFGETPSETLRRVQGGVRR
jgi:AraC-like DNA-binding protein